MNNFIVLIKPLSFSTASKDTFGYSFIQLSYFFQETFKSNPSYLEYKIDETTVKVENISGQLCLLCLAFKKTH